MVRHPARRGVHATRAIEHLERSGPAPSEGLSRATVRPVGPRSNTAMSALMTAPRWTFGTGIPST
jgi:hypothetical protein